MRLINTLTLPRPASNLCPFRFSIGSRPSPRPALWARLQSTWRGWPSSSSSVLANAALPRTTTPFAFPTSPSSSGPPAWISSRPPPPICAVPPTSPLRLTTRKTANAAKSLLMAAAATPLHAPPCPSFAASSVCVPSIYLLLASPLCTYVDSQPTPLTTNHITTLLRAAARSLLTLGFAPNNVNARSLRAGGAMALLCGRVDADTIRLVGRWRSDAMFRYLHAQALPLIRDLSRIMLTHGAYTLLPGTDLPQPAAQLVAAAPPPLDG